MLYDHRTYTCRPGTIQKHIDLYITHGFAAQARHVGPPIVFAVTEAGDLNSYVHIWGYASLQDRAEKRAAMQADPEWQAYVKLSREAGYLLKQENIFLQSITLTNDLTFASTAR
jgi:hypothetical protein